MSGITFSKTNRGGTVLVHENYLYTKERKFWRCKDRTCGGRLQHDPVDDAVIITVRHNHPASKSEVIKNEFKVNFKKRAGETLEPPRQIIASLSQELPIEVAATLPSYHAMQHNIEKIRQRNRIPLPNPDCLADFNTTQYLQQSSRGEQFLLHDSGPEDPERFIVFVTEGNLGYLQRAETWLADGTFKASPPLFTQLYTVHGSVNGTTIPLVYALLPNKSAATYERLFGMIRDKIHQQPGCQNYAGPKVMVTDFEQAAFNSFKKVYPQTEIQGCLFHFGQCIYRKIQDLGLAKEYGSDTLFNLHCRMLIALAFVRPNKVVEAFVSLQDMPNWTMEQSREREQLMSYFETTFVGEFARNGRRKRPLFAIEFWNCHNRVIAGVERTNNRLEAWHKSFTVTLGVIHPTIYSFFGKLQKEQSFQEVALEKLNSGNTPAKRKKVYEALNARIKKIVDEFDENNLISFLRGMALNVELNP